MNNQQHQGGQQLCGAPCYNHGSLWKNPGITMAVDIPIIRTKILLPRRRQELLRRERLLSVLEDLLDYKLWIIAAPAGYGKTSLLIDYASQSNIPICWLAIDPFDNDPIRFVGHIIASIQERFPDFGKASMAALLNTSQEAFNVDAVISAIGNDIYDHITEHFVLFLDDYHLVRDNKTIDNFINRLVQDTAENFHILIASRTLLTLPDMTLLVARSQVNGLSFEELSFNTREIQELLKTNFNQEISEEMAVDLVSQTEGWITGLLLTIQLPGNEFANRLRIARVSGVGLYEYLAQQVFDRQPVEIQEFLLRTSLLEEFDVELCEKILEPALGLQAPPWMKMMEKVLRDNLFILPVGEESVWLRYHHLFRDFLQTKIRQQRPEEVVQIEQTLAQYYESRQEWERAFPIYARNQWNDQLVRLIEKAGSYMVTNGRVVSLMDWLNYLPPGSIDVNPILLSLQATIEMILGETGQAMKKYSLAVMQLEKNGSIEEYAQSVLRRASAYRQLGEYIPSLTDIDRVITVCSEDINLRSLLAEAEREKALVYYLQGRLHEGLITIKHAKAIMQELGRDREVAKIQMEEGLFLKATGDFSGAANAYQQALNYWQRTSNAIWQANVLNNIGVLQHLQGNFESAISTYERALQYARSSAYPRLEAFILTGIGDVYRDLEAYSEANQIYDIALGMSQRIHDKILNLYLELAKAINARWTGEGELFRTLWEKAYDKARLGGSHFEINLCLLEYAIYHLKNQCYEEALETISTPEAFFQKEGHLTDLVRARLIHAMALAGGRKSLENYGWTSSIETLLSANPNLIPVITLGREVPGAMAQLVETASDEIALRIYQKARDFDTEIGRQRKMLRRKDISIPFAPPRLVIRSFGRMTVRVNGKMVSGADWQSVTARDLFFFILHHPEGLTKEEIGEAFWPDSSPAELKLRFKNAIYRVRHAVGNSAVLFENELYRFNRSMDYEYDVEIFRRELNFADQYNGSKAGVDHLKKAIAQYKGIFQPDMDILWAVAEREFYAQRYKDANLRLISYCIDKQAFQDAVVHCNLILKEDGCLEEVHRQAMLAYSGMGDRAGVVRQFEICRSNLEEGLGVEPSTQTQNLFKMLTT